MICKFHFTWALFFINVFFSFVLKYFLIIVNHASRTFVVISKICFVEYYPSINFILWSVDQFTFLMTINTFVNLCAAFTFKMALP